MEVPDGMTEDAVFTEINICLGSVDSEFTNGSEVLEIHNDN